MLDNSGDSRDDQTWLSNKVGTYLWTFRRPSSPGLLIWAHYDTSPSLYSASGSRPDFVGFRGLGEANEALTLEDVESSRQAASGREVVRNQYQPCRDWLF